MARIVKKSFYTTGSWTAPAGVTSVVLQPVPTTISKGSGSGNAIRALDAQGKAYAWGSNSAGELGVGDTTPRSSPVAVVGGLFFTQITGSGAGGAIDSTGKFYGWGNNLQGAIADGTTVNKSSPTPAIGGLFFKKIATGTACLGLAPDGKLYGWGNNSAGALGLGDTTNRSSPVPVVGGLLFKNMICNGGNSFGLTVGGQLYAWGRNANGQLGDGTVVAKSSPVPVLGGLTFVDMAAFDTDCVAITADGTPYAWGANAAGEIGDGTTIPKSSPVAVLGGLKFIRVYSAGDGLGASHYGLTKDGTLYAWGGNVSGQLGVGDVIPRSSPVAVLGGLKFVQIVQSVGNSNTGGAAIAAITADGTLYAWGGNNNGQLGLGDVIPRSSPVAVLGGIRFAPIDEKPLAPITVPVTPGTSYSISFNGPNMYFGDVFVGSLINGLELFYRQ